MQYDGKRALQLLRAGSGVADANFRDSQETAIAHLVEGRSRLLVVQKTGWGKSFVYFIATKLLREAGMGPAVLISPLLALMRNQVEAAERMGVRAATINSNNVDEWQAIEARLRDGDIDILLISPERLANPRFMQEVLGPLVARVALLVVDEAHCISDWGHDFRPHYRLLERIIHQLPDNLRLLATTATANNRVMDDLHKVLGPNLHSMRGSLERTSLTLQTLRLPGQAQRLAWLDARLNELAGHGIIYTLTVRDAEQVTAWLRSRGHEVEAYSGQTGERRGELEDALLNNRVKALVATTALGMGYDKPDLAFVIHYQMPGSVVAYYQQVGRAGRALKAAYGVLLSGAEEAEINDWFIRSAFPSREEAATVIEALDQAPDGLSTRQLEARVNLSSGRIKKTLELLALESPAPVIKQKTHWQLTSAPLGEAFWQRAERLTQLRREEQRQMQAYVALPFGEHMTFLVNALDGDPDAVVPPSLPPLSTQVNDAIVQQAQAYLRGDSLGFEPRRQWPAGGLPRYGLKGNIRPDWRAQPGRVLCRWDDAGWGQQVRAGKQQSGRFDDELVAALVDLLATNMPVPAPNWVTCVPSRRHPQLVADLAQRLAQRLGLPFHEVLEQTADRPPQNRFFNSVQQALNLDGTISWNRQPMPQGAVWLVDDSVGSRWTITLAAAALRSRGSGEVWPLVLAERR